MATAIKDIEPSINDWCSQSTLKVIIPEIFIKILETNRTLLFKETAETKIPKANSMRIIGLKFSASNGAKIKAKTIILIPMEIQNYPYQVVGVDLFDCRGKIYLMAV
ncbi:MAG: hypothetical protein AAFP76_11190, partial [Bacteroidota bacterium]